MLSGDAIFNNPVYQVSPQDPNILNDYPTIENLIDIVKELNGVGEIRNSMLSDYWSSRVAQGLFEHEQTIEFHAMPELELADYPVVDSLDMYFKAVAKHMKSHEIRKVNRDVFVLGQGHYDMHGGDGLPEKFQVLNAALDSFITEIKSQNLWDSTVIVQGSEFGRSLNPNSNMGTDHACEWCSRSLYAVVCITVRFFCLIFSCPLFP